MILVKLTPSRCDHVFDAAKFALLGDSRSKVIVIVLFSFIVSMWTLPLSPTSTGIGDIAYAQSSGNLSGDAGTTNETITLLRYLNPTFGIELDYPSSWQALELWKSPTPSNSIVAFFPSADNSSSGNASSYRDILLVSMQNSRGKTLNDYTSESLTAYGGASNLNASNITITKSTPTTLSGIPAHEISYRENLEGSELMKKQIWTIIDNRVYVVTYGADASQYMDYLPDVDRMISSLKIARVPPELTNTEVGPFTVRELPIASNGLLQEYFSD